MKANHTECIFLIDSSGSMAGKEADVIGGFNAFITEQRKAPGSCSITVVDFNTRHRIICENQNVHDFHSLDYVASGLTALYDTCGAIIKRVGERYASAPESERPENVIFIIVTDGFNTTGEKYRADDVRKMIEHQATKYNWQFIYMGAHADAWGAARSIGVPVRNTVQTDGDFVKTFGAGGQSVTNYRVTKSFVSTPGETLQDEYNKA